MKTIKQYGGTVTSSQCLSLPIVIGIGTSKYATNEKMHQTLTSVLSPTRPQRSNDTVCQLESRAGGCYVIQKTG